MCSSLQTQRTTRSIPRPKPEWGTEPKRRRSRYHSYVSMGMLRAFSRLISLATSVSLSLPPMISPYPSGASRSAHLYGARVLLVLLHVERLALLGEVGDEHRHLLVRGHGALLHRAEVAARSRAHVPSEFSSDEHIGDRLTRLKGGRISFRSSRCPGQGASAPRAAPSAPDRPWRETRLLLDLHVAAVVHPGLLQLQMPVLGQMPGGAGLLRPERGGDASRPGPMRISAPPGTSGRSG